MNKWRLLLFSVFGLLQITTSDRNFIDGRDRCCHHSLPNSKSDTRISLYEPFRVYSLLPELRQLKSPEYSRRERDPDHRRSSYRPHINYRVEHWRDSTSRRDENRRANDRQRIRELTRDNEVQDILRARTNRQKISTTDSRVSYSQNDARIERPENRHVRLYTRETFPRNAHKDLFNIRRESLEREGRVSNRFTHRHTMSVDTDYATENRNNRLNSRKIIFVRDNRDDFEKRTHYFAKTEVSDEIRNALNNLGERVSRLRTRRNSLNDELRQTEEFRSRFSATREYDNMATRNHIRIVRDNREESLNKNLRALRESRTQTERNNRLIKRSVSDEIARDEDSLINKREYRGMIIQRSSRISETSRDIRLGRQNNENKDLEYTDSRSNKGDSRRLTSNHLNIQRINDEDLFKRDTRIRKTEQNLRYTLRNDNDNCDLRRQVLREKNEQRNKININHRDTLNIIERHIQIDESRNNIRDSREIKTERSSEELTVRNNNGQRRESNRVLDETRLRRAKIYNRDNINEAVPRIRSQSLINSRRSERSAFEERRIRQTAEETLLDKNNVHVIVEDLQRRSRNMQGLAIKLDSRDLSEYEGLLRNSHKRYRRITQNSRSNLDDETRRIRSQVLEERNSIRRTNVQNIRDTSDNYLQRIASRSLKERFSLTSERDQIRNKDIRNNKILREQYLQKRSTRDITEESRVRNPSLSTSNDVRNYRYNVNRDVQERINGQRVNDFRSINIDIRNEVLNSQRFRTMQERLSNIRIRHESRIRITNLRKALDDQNNKESKPRTTEERRNLKSQSVIVVVHGIDEEARRIRSRNQKSIARPVLDKSIRITNVASNRNIEVDSNRIRSRSMTERANRGDTRITIERSASISSEIRNTRNNDEARYTRHPTERVTNNRQVQEMSEKRRFNENNQEKTEMRLMTSLARENRSRTTNRDIYNKQSASSIFEMKWQYLFYAMQGIYLCSFFMKISKDEESKKKSRMINWLTPMNMKID